MSFVEQASSKNSQRVTISSVYWLMALTGNLIFEIIVSKSSLFLRFHYLLACEYDISISPLINLRLSAILSFAVSSALHRGLNISCGCFSASSTEQIGYVTLIRALVIMLISAVAYLSIVSLQPHKEKLLT